MDDINDDGMDVLNFSDDEKLIVVNEYVFYKYTHTNEDGVKQYIVCGVTNKRDEAVKFLSGEKSNFTKVKQVN